MTTQTNGDLASEFASLVQADRKGEIIAHDSTSAQAVRLALDWNVAVYDLTDEGAKEIIWNEICANKTFWGTEYQYLPTKFVTVIGDSDNKTQGNFYYHFERLDDGAFRSLMLYRGVGGHWFIPVGDDIDPAVADQTAGCFLSMVAYLLMRPIPVVYHPPAAQTSNIRKPNAKGSKFLSSLPLIRMISLSAVKHVYTNWPGSPGRTHASPIPHDRKTHWRTYKTPIRSGPNKDKTKIEIAGYKVKGGYQSAVINQVVS